MFHLKIWLKYKKGGFMNIKNIIGYVIIANAILSSGAVDKDFKDEMDLTIKEDKEPYSSAQSELYSSEEVTLDSDQKTDSKENTAIQEIDVMKAFETVE